MDNQNDIISVIVPVYNVRPYLAMCVQSVCGQTYRALEILLIDDGSTDGSGEVCDALAAQDPRIRVIHTENGGQCAARNRGLDAAGGKYVFFLDSDDLLLPDICERLHALAIEHDAQVVRCNFFPFSDWNAIPDTARREDSNAVRVFTPREALQNFVCAPYSARKAFIPAVWSTLFLRTLFDTVRFPEGLIYEEGFVLPKVFLQCKKLVHLDASLYAYFRNPAGTMSSASKAKGLKSLDDWREIHELLSPLLYPELQAPTAERWANKYIRTFTDLEAHPELDPDRIYRDKIVSVLREQYAHLRTLLSRETLRDVNAVRRGKVPKPSKLYGYIEAARNKLR